MPRYTYNESLKVLSLETPLTNKDELLAVCKEVDEEVADTEINLFIESAHLIVCEHLDGWGVSTGRLTLVERYLAAHFAAITYIPAVFESVGKVQASYQAKVALNLDQTRYGQQAKLFDPTGELKKLSDGVFAKRYGITWLGMTNRDWRLSTNATVEINP